MIKYLVIAGIVALLVTGFINGAIGSSIFGKERFLEKPHIALPPQPVFPQSVRDHHLGYSDEHSYESVTKHQDDSHGKSDGHGDVHNSVTIKVTMIMDKAVKTDMQMKDIIQLL